MSGTCDIICGPLRAERPAPIGVSALLVGKKVEDAADLLPRLFNLCRSAQQTGARLAFGLPLNEDQHALTRQGILREHLIKFCVSFPAQLDMASTALPQGWQTGGDAVRKALFGTDAVLPQTKAGFVDFLEMQTGLGAVLARIRDGFAPGEACSGVLPEVVLSNALSATALENSVAGRQAAHPVLRAIEGSFGRGPLWRATARVYDMQDCLDGTLPAPVSPSPGVAIVPAARGTYAISARVSAGIVTAFQRITPTDHLLARGGILDQTLATLPERKTSKAQLVMDILDPCTPVHLKAVGHA